MFTRHRGLLEGKGQLKIKNDFTIKLTNGGVMRKWADLLEH